MKIFSGLITLLLTATSNAFCPAPSQTKSVELNALNEAVAYLSIIPILGLVNGIARDREQYYVDDTMKAKKGGDSRGAQAEDTGLSIPYDAAARNAFAASGGEEDDFEEFKAKYEQDAIAIVIAKQAKRLGKPNPLLAIDYDAAAKLAFDNDEESGDDFEAFKAKYEKETIEMITAKQKARQSK
eukprot:CAMPEP_0194130520 /NCGR_PEP_ID=MMETSP0152-20130528/1552_1 /TAXON_ID=1049557 /ORGANISM="Thalassiothrix antarctica, Strain L6-D1" /LENGTH=183 /DNA_ID=CAMNT_0038825071 /DNA_START=20 /DNA_END=571 /DNA_ORIENTATION=+